MSLQPLLISADSCSGGRRGLREAEARLPDEISVGGTLPEPKANRCKDTPNPGPVVRQTGRTPAANQTRAGTTWMTLPGRELEEGLTSGSEERDSHIRTKWVSFCRIFEESDQEASLYS
ncbi:hypothetical protein CapIbe_021740 [Capra ibex]